MGSTTTKTIKGNEYLYYVYYENRKKKEVYCGLASKSESKKEAIRLEIESLKEQKRELSEKVNQLEAKMGSV